MFSIWYQPSRIRRDGEINDGKRAKVITIWKTTKWDAKASEIIYLPSMWQRGLMYQHKTSHRG